MQKDNFFTQAWFQPIIFFLKKGVNYDKLKLRQNSVKGPKYPNRKKMPKSNIKFQNLPKNSIIKQKIAASLTFSTNQREIVKRFYLR